MHIDELELLISEIEFDDMFTQIQKENRKLKRDQDKMRKKGIRRLAFRLLIYAFLLNTIFKMKYPSYDNYYSKDELIASDDDIKDGLNELEKKLNIKIDSQDAKDYLILKSILDNQQINETEKKVALELFPILKENQYYNKEYTYHSLETLDIDWCERTSDVDENCTGLFARKYKPFKGYVGEIKDFLSEENEQQLNYPVLRHELIHALFSINNVFLPRSFEEGMTELLVNEYYEDNPYIEVDSYPFEILYVKMLCEIVGPNRVLESYTTGNMDIIYDDMALIQGTKKDAKELLNGIDDFITNRYDNKCDYDKYNELFSKLDSYVNLRVENKDTYFYYRSLMDSIKSIEPYSDYTLKLFMGEELGMNNKAYFSKALTSLKTKTLKTK